MSANSPKHISALWPTRAWWAALVVLVVGAGALRFSAINFGLPHVEQPDECNSYWSATGQYAIYRNGEFYPPAYVTMARIMLALRNDSEDALLKHITAMRPLTVLAALGAMVLIGLLAYRVAGPTAGLLAAALWAVEPDMVHQSRHALPDTYVALCGIAALLAVVLWLQTSRKRWVYISAGLGILTFLFKYHALPVLLAVLMIPVAVALLRRRTPPWRASLISAAASGAIAVWRLFFAGGLKFSLEVRDPVTVGGDNNLENLYDYFADNLAGAIGAYDTLAVVAVVGLLLMLVWRAGRAHVDWAALAAVAATALFFWAGMSAFRHQPYRRLYPLGAQLLVIGSVGLTAYAHAIRDALSRLAWPPARRAWVWGAVVTGLAAVALAPTIQTTLDDISFYRKPDIQVDIMEWADYSLPPGRYIGDISEYNDILSPHWGIYQGDTRFEFHYQSSLVDEPVEVWREADVQYTFLSDFAYRQLLEQPELGEVYLGETLLLKRFQRSPGERGPETAVLRLTPIQHPLDVHFEDGVVLAGYDLSTDRVAPGESFTVTYYWQAASTPNEVYNVFTHLTPPDSFEVITQADGTPVSEQRPTISWDDPGETLIGQTFSLTVDETLPLGDYQLRVGLYVWYSGDRLPLLQDYTDSYPLAVITVTGDERAEK
jgi:hypothetical protein